jgi:hypothetical protein
MCKGQVSLCQAKNIFRCFVANYPFSRSPPPSTASNIALIIIVIFIKKLYFNAYILPGLNLSLYQLLSSYNSSLKIIHNYFLFVKMCFKRFNITDLGFVSSTVGACIDDECAKDCNCCNSAFLASSLAVIVDTAGRTGG